MLTFSSLQTLMRTCLRHGRGTNSTNSCSKNNTQLHYDNIDLQASPDPHCVVLYKRAIFGASTNNNKYTKYNKAFLVMSTHRKCVTARKK